MLRDSIRPYISFAIASYNRSNLTYRLASDLLSNTDKRIEVLVVDDASSDDTLKNLEKIKDSRFKVFKHVKNMGPKMTWFDTYEQAQGEWVFCINDRDVINTKYVAQLIDILERLSAENVGFVVAGEKWLKTPTKDYILYEKGFETIEEFGLRNQHPTGQIFKRDCWIEIENRKEYFMNDKYGIYPHGFIETIMGNRYSGAYILFDICDMEHYSDRMKLIPPSCVYKSQGKEYFLPSQRYKLLELMLDNVNLINDRKKIKELTLSRYKKWFNSATIEYFYYMNNELVKFRYGYTDINISTEEIIAYGKEYVKSFREYLYDKNFNWINKEFMKTLGNLESKLMIQLADWKDVKNKEYLGADCNNIILYGAGRRGQKAIACGIAPKYICDSSLDKIGKQLYGMTIKSFEDCEKLYDSNTVFLITPINIDALISIARQLLEKGYRYRFFV